MSKTVIRNLIILFASLAVLLPLWLRFHNLSWSAGSLLANLFPFFGLAAFSILWLHIAGAGIESWLNRYIDFQNFVEKTSIYILIFIILHPLLLFVDFGFSLAKLSSSYDLLYIRLGVLGLLLLLVYDLGRIFRNKQVFIKHWNKVLLISSIGFWLIFFHSLNLGSDLQSGPLRAIWIFYGSTATLSTIYVCGIKRFL